MSTTPVPEEAARHAAFPALDLNARLADSGADGPNTYQIHHSGGFVQLPTDRARANDTPFAPATVDVAAPTNWRQPTEEAQRARALAAVIAVLHRYTQQEQLTIESEVCGNTEVSLMRGTVPPRSVRISCPVAAADPLTVLADTVAEQLHPFDRAGDYDAPPDTGRPGTNICVSFVESAAALATVNRRPYELHLLFMDVGDRAGVRALYNANLFDVQTVERLTSSVLRAAATLEQDSHIRVRELAVLSIEEHRQLTEDWSSGSATYPGRPVFREFEAHVRAHPEKVVATLDGDRITYGQLDARSNRLAAHLAEQGVARGGVVAVCVPPSFDVLVAMLAIFKVGGVYLPLDPTHPQALIASILDEARPKLVLTHSALSPLTAPERFAHFHFDLDEQPLANRASAAESAFDPSALSAWADAPDALDGFAYQLYTSGTTGRPKAVMATHRNLAHYIHVAQQRYGFGADDVFCSLARFTFSISLFELLSPLCCGGTLRLMVRDDVLAPDRLAQALAEVTVVHAGPTLLANLFRYMRATPGAPVGFTRMRHASSGGDLVPAHLLEQMKRVFENAELFVIYGCTEISCMGTTFAVPREPRVERSFVGKPFPDVSVRLVDPEMNLVPVGVVGEICFSGSGVVGGYLERPALTAEKFVDFDGKRFYRTGDLGRLHADGNLEILGRRDFQVQVRGIRIELAGIENTIRELGLASQCAVVVKKLDELDVRLVAFVVKPSSDAVVDVATFRHAMAERLPDYMLPQSVVVLDALPVTVNGKLDRRRLDELPWQPAMPAPATARVAPRSAIERNIAAAFARCLSLPDDAVGIDDDFFDLGGHSLLAVMLLTQLQDKLGTTFPPDVLFANPTVRTLAAYAQGAFTEGPRPILLNGNQNGPVLYALVGVHLYRDLARHLEQHYSVRAVYAGRELVMFESPEQAPSVDALAREYVEIIRRHQPHGPYRLLGMSFGGIVAYEVARQLRDAGETVSFLGLLDAVLPEQGLRRRISQLDRLRSLPFGKLTGLLGARARQLWATISPAARREVEYRGEARLLPLEDQRQEAYRLATRDYVDRMTPFTGPVTLVVARDRMDRVLMQSRSLGWSDVASEIQVHDVASDHLGLLQEPAVAEVSALLVRDIRAAESGPEGQSS